MQASLDEAVYFVTGLIKYEAIKEDCAIGPRRNLDDITVIRELASVFDYTRIHITISGDGAVQPPFTSFLLVNWIPKK